MKNSKAFILSSLWEDPGFVIIEAALYNYLLFQVIVKMDLKNFFTMEKQAFFLRVIVKMLYLIV